MRLKYLFIALLLLISTDIFSADKKPAVFKQPGIVQELQPTDVLTDIGFFSGLGILFSTKIEA